MTHPAPTLAAAPTLEQVAAVFCPVERARLLTAVSRTCGTLPRPLADLRRAAIAQALLNDGWRTTQLAQAVGLSKSRISQLMKTFKGGAAVGSGAIHPAVAATPTKEQP